MAARKIVKRKGASPKLFFDRFLEYKKEDVIEIFSKLPLKDRKLMEKCFGENLDSLVGYYSLDLSEKKRINIIVNKIRNVLNKRNVEKEVSVKTPTSVRQRRILNERNGESFCLTSDLVSDMFNRIGYRPLSFEEEVYWIKKAKLSLYKSSSEKERKLYFDYYCDVTPKFKEKYVSASEDKRKKLLYMAIEDSKMWYSKFIANNQRLVRKLISSYPLVPVDEGMQEGNIGLMKAFQRFDINFGNKFSTYATWWIKQSVSRFEIQGTELIRVPVHAMEFFKSMAWFENNFYSIHGRYPTDEEIIEELGYTEFYINKYREYVANYKNMASLDQVVSTDDDDSSLGDFIPDDYEFTEEVDSDIVVSAFLKMFSELNINSKHKEIFLLYNGFLDGTPHTLEYVGKKYGLTRERIRQINRKVIMKLKDDPSVMMFFDYDNLQKVDYSLRDILISDNGIDSLTRKILYRKYVLGYDNNKIALEFGLSNEELFNILDAGLRILKTRYPLMVNDVQKTIKIKRK